MARPVYSASSYTALEIGMADRSGLPGYTGRIWVLSLETGKRHHLILEFS